jgi:hypothetical protein
MRVSTAVVRGGVSPRLVLPALVLAAIWSVSGAQARPHVTFPCEVCLVQVGIDGHGQRLLQRGPPPITDISPDGKRLLYAKYQVGLFTSAIDGSDEREVVADPRAGDASYSPRRHADRVRP